MSSNKKEQIVSEASPHTIKKFDLIEKYVESWAQKLCNNQYCKGIIFIDCMCNSGEYFDEHGETVYGTPVRVAKILRNVAGQYPRKKFALYFSDLNDEKIEHLKNLLPNEKNNFFIRAKATDGNELLKRLSVSLSKKKNIHTLLVYDPYDARIDWEAITPYFNTWGEVILNHMVSDPIRAIKQAKRERAIDKYRNTYMTDIEELIKYNGDKDAYEKRIENIIKTLRNVQNRDFYIASFPFFNSRNSVVYNLIHCTGHIKGFSLYKETAWKIFGGKSSDKNIHGNEKQFILDFESDGNVKTETDEYCYNINDIAYYIQKKYAGQQAVAIDDIWKILEAHPVFPHKGFRKEIKKELKTVYGAKEYRATMSFAQGR